MASVVRPKLPEHLLCLRPLRPLLQLLLAGRETGNPPFFIRAASIALSNRERIASFSSG